MSLRCPLCLETLQPDSQLQRFCMSHPASPATVYPYRALDRIQCRERRHSSTAVMSGTFLLHVGCPSRNVFWNEAEGKITVQPKSLETTSESGKRVFEEVDHW